MWLFCSIGRIDMIQSAFERFTRIFLNGAIYEALICIIEKNGAIFVILLHHFWMKICEKIEKHAISWKMAPFFILWLHVSHDRIFWRLWTQLTHPQLSGAYNTFHIRKWRHFHRTVLIFSCFFAKNGAITPKKWRHFEYFGLNDKWKYLGERHMSQQHSLTFSRA